MTVSTSRRETLKSAALGALVLAASGAKAAAAAPAQTLPEPAEYSLPPLPYPYDSLAPAINENVIRIHHDKHHAGYVKGLNAALAKLDAARRAGDMSAVKALSRDLAFNGSGHVLHTLYWNSMKPGGSPAPEGALAKAIERDFGSFQAFRTQFVAAANDVEASGWALLGWEPMGKRLLVLQAEKHQNLALVGAAPLMACDVWEHAYYLQYENRRGDYVENFFKTVDWVSVGLRYVEAAG